MMYMCVIGGMLIGGLGWLTPPELQMGIPGFFRILMFAIGAIFTIIGPVLVHMRAINTTTHHIIEPSKPGRINWLYAYKDGELIFTPSMREVGSQLYNKQLDAQIVADLKSYKMYDHNIRVVPEGLAFSQDLDYVLYADLLKGKHGLENLKEARQGLHGKIGLKEEQLPYEKLDRLQEGNL